MSDRVGVRGMVRGTRENLPYWLDRLPAVPGHLIDLMERMRQGKLEVQWRSRELEALRHELRRDRRAALLRMGGGILVLSGVILYAVSGVPAADARTVSWLLGGLGAVLLLLAARG